MVRPGLYVTRNHGDGNPVTRVMGDSISRVMGDPWPKTMVMVTLWPRVTHDPIAMVTRDPRPWWPCDPWPYDSGDGNPWWPVTQDHGDHGDPDHGENAGNRPDNPVTLWPDKTRDHGDPVTHGDPWPGIPVTL